MTTQSYTELTFAERLAKQLESEATVSQAKWDNKGGQNEYVGKCGQTSNDPWKLNHYR